MVGIRLFAVAGTLASLAMGKALNTKMDDCKYNALGTPVPDENTYQLPLEGFRQTRSYPLCIDNTTKCDQEIPVYFGFKNHGIQFRFSQAQGYQYSQIHILLDNKVPSGSSVSWTQDSTECERSTSGDMITCTLPYSDLVSGGMSGANNVSPMCPNGDAEAWTFEFEMSAILRNQAGRFVTAQDKESCEDYPTCNKIRPETWWALTYRCTKCPNSGLNSSAPAHAHTHYPECKPSTLLHTRKETQTRKEYVTQTHATTITKDGHTHTVVKQETQTEKETLKETVVHTVPAHTESFPIYKTNVVYSTVTTTEKGAPTHVTSVQDG